jgi:hypothetical protein
MSRTTRSFSKACAVALGLLAASLITTAVQAATIIYGNFGPVPPGISFLGVREGSGTDPVPLYGPPTPFTIGLDFDPIAFVATSANGGADITDGQVDILPLQGSIVGTAVKGIGTIKVDEAGDYTLAGAGGPATSVFGGAIIRAKVTEINGVTLAIPISLTPSNATFSDALPGQVVVGPWAVSTTLNVQTQLAGLGFNANQAATKVEVTINNSLVATSEPNSVAFIAKKDFQITVTTDDGIVPEPSTFAMAGLALCGLGFASRKRG